MKVTTPPPKGGGVVTEIVLRQARENGLDPEHVVEAFEMGMGAWLALRKYLEVFK